MDPREKRLAKERRTCCMTILIVILWAWAMTNMVVHKQLTNRSRSVDADIDAKLALLPKHCNASSVNDAIELAYDLRLISNPKYRLAIVQVRAFEQVEYLLQARLAKPDFNDLASNHASLVSRAMCTNGGCEESQRAVREVEADIEELWKAELTHNPALMIWPCFEKRFKDQLHSRIRSEMISEIKND